MNELTPEQQIATLNEKVRILRDKLETANETIKRLESNQIPDMSELSHDARAMFYKSVLPQPLVDAWKAAERNDCRDYKAAVFRVYDALDDILSEFNLFG